MKKKLREVLGIPLSNGIKQYLGCSIVQGRIKINFLKLFLNLKGKKKQLFGKACFLSRVGKIVMIKVNLANYLLIYELFLSSCMNCFKIVKVVIILKIWIESIEIYFDCQM